VSLKAKLFISNAQMEPEKKKLQLPSQFFAILPHPKKSTILSFLN